jgi:type I restriction enzyme S subunit
MGSSPPSSTYNEDREGLPFYQGNADFGHLNPEVSTWCSDPVKTAQEGDILMSVRAPVGDLNIASETCCIGRGLAALRSKKANNLFLFYCLAKRSRWLSRLAAGSTFKSISSGDLAKVEVPIPPLPEQRKIASVLATIDAAIQKTEAVIDQAKRVKRGLMQDLFTCGIDSSGTIRSSEDPHTEFQKTPLGRVPESWECTRLGSLVEKLGGLIQTGPFGSQLHQEEYVNEGVPVVMPQDIENGHIDDSDIARITPEKANDLSRHRMQEDDVVLARRGNLERAAVISEREEGWVCGTGCLLIRPPAKRLDGSWLSAVYQHPMIQSQIKAQAVGSTMLNLNQSILENLQLALPSVKEQKQIVGVLSSFDNKIEEECRKRNTIRRLKRGLMQDLLSGRVRTSDKDIAILDEVAAHG